MGNSGSWPGTGLSMNFTPAVRKLSSPGVKLSCMCLCHSQSSQEFSLFSTAQPPVPAWCAWASVPASDTDVHLVLRACSLKDAIQNLDTGCKAPAALPLSVILVIFGSEVHFSEFSSAHGRIR